MKRDLSNRVHLLDELRGFAIICMVFYHAMYDLVVLFRIDFPLFTSPIMQDILQPLFAGLFILISGAVGHYSRSNVKRGAICFGFGMVLTLVTYFVMPRAFIAFGILHFLGIAMMLFPLLSKAAAKLPPLAGMAVGLVLFWFFSGLPSGSVALPRCFRSNCRRRCIPRRTSSGSAYRELAFTARITLQSFRGFSSSSPVSALAVL